MTTAGRIMADVYKMPVKQIVQMYNRDGLNMKSNGAFTTKGKEKFMNSNLQMHLPRKTSIRTVLGIQKAQALRQFAEDQLILRISLAKIGKSTANIPWADFIKKFL